MSKCSAQGPLPLREGPSLLALWAPANLGYKSGFLWGGGPLEAGPWEEEEGEPVEPHTQPWGRGDLLCPEWFENAKLH